MNWRMIKRTEQDSTNPNACEARERAILGGLTLEECLKREGGGFWLRLTDQQTEALKQNLAECSSQDAKTPR